MRAVASSDWNSSQNAANPRPGGSAATANSPTRQHAGGDRHAVDQPPEAVEPARAGTALHRVGAQQQQRPAQHVADQRQPRRLERVRCDRRQVDRAGEQRHPERHRRHPEQMQRADRHRRVQRVRERRAQRSDRGDGGARQQQRHAPPQRLRRAAQVEQHAEHQIDGDRRADPGQRAGAGQHQQQHARRRASLRAAPIAYGGEVTRRTRQRERHDQADRRKDGEAQRHARHPAAADPPTA